MKYVTYHIIALTGAIPEAIGGWAMVEQVDMSENSFSGDSGLPTTIGMLTECEELVFHQSGIGGTLPTEVGMMTKLETLDLSQNKKADTAGEGLKGEIPAAIGMLGGTLENLVLFDNSMEGTLSWLAHGLPLL